MKPLLINISGSSGVGKTTVATMVALILSTPNKKVLHLCGDDLHKWERESKNWKKLTHFNPNANNLDLGKKQLLNLLNGESIIRDVYDHDLGRFIRKVDIDSADVIINEGLHSLYDSYICNIADLNIYVHTDNKLKLEWKMMRDISSRGYTTEQVLFAVEMRKDDEKLYIQPQSQNADVIIGFSKKRYETVELSCNIINKKDTDLIERIQRFYELHKNFLMATRNLSFEYDLIQGAGGNLSYKFDDKLIITSSGYSMADVSMLKGYSVCDLHGIPINKLQKRPSMETSMHINITSPVVLHAHPIYLNVILCSAESQEIMSSILSSYDYVPYTSPGEDLARTISKLKHDKVILLENHGLICHGNTFVDVLESNMKINQICKRWLIKNAKTFTMHSDIFKDINSSDLLFPDAVILMKENKSVNDYILHMQEEVGLTSKPLTTKEINTLKHMDAEKYRRDLI